MNNIYVDELPKDCSECPMCRSGNLKLQRKGRYIEAKQCVFGQYKYQTIDDEINTCPLKPLTDRLAEERKKVIGELKVDIRSLFNAYASSLLDYCIWSINAYTHKNIYNNFKRVINNRLDKVLDLFDKRIDQVERGE